MLDEAQKDHYLQALGVQRWVLRTQNSTLPSAALAIEQLDWSDLRTRVAQCTACALCTGRKQTVFGVGDQQADLLIVGEAPGYYEDKQGEPFVGRAGQLLNEMLKTIGLARTQVYIANVLKCRPPNNRDPRPEEVAQCTPYLERQVNLLQPALILAMGRHAAHFLLETTQSLASLRRRTHVFKQTNIPLIVTYHPAYLLRNPKDKRKTYIDLQTVYELMQLVDK